MTATTSADPTHCTATRHGHALAYMVDRCRCDTAAEDYRIYRKRLREGRHVAAYVDQTGTGRRLRALAVIGWGPVQLGERLGYTRITIQQLRAGYRTRIRRDTAARVALLYDELSGTPGPSSRMAAFARRAGWTPPLLWDGIDIDDPTAVPDTDEPGPAGPRVRLDEVDHLTRSGLTLEQAAARLGVHVDSVAQARRRRARNQQSEAA